MLSPNCPGIGCYYRSVNAFLFQSEKVVANLQSFHMVMLLSVAS